MLFEILYTTSLKRNINANLGHIWGNHANERSRRCEEQLAVDLNGEVLFLYPSVGNSLNTPQHTNTIGRDETDYVEDKVEDLIRPRAGTLHC